MNDTQRKAWQSHLAHWKAYLYYTDKAARARKPEKKAHYQREADDALRLSREAIAERAQPASL